MLGLLPSSGNWQYVFDNAGVAGGPLKFTILDTFAGGTGYQAGGGVPYAHLLGRWHSMAGVFGRATTTLEHYLDGIRYPAAVGVDTGNSLLATPSSNHFYIGRVGVAGRNCEMNVADVSIWHEVSAPMRSVRFTMDAHR